ncbi:MAG TPA: type II toxin-antitoxin system PemK/MazF family toxin [Bryobacteraceae bacterium]|nr:type II toxin-antitoxin system PemK/MazF family toxin [Bryobacteraceae bacterium]
MERGDLYLVRKIGSLDPKRQRVYAVVSRQALIDSKYSTVICCPVYSRYDGLSTQVEVGVNEGLKHPSSLHCDELVSLPKSALTQYVGGLGSEKLTELDAALALALGLL